MNRDDNSAWLDDIFDNLWWLDERWPDKYDIEKKKAAIQAKLAELEREARLDELELIPYINDRLDVYKGHRRSTLTTQKDTE